DMVWAKSFGNWKGEQVESVAVDSSGNVYTTGMSFGTVDFDPGPGTTNLGDDYSNAFVSKLDSSGNLAPAVAATPGTPGFTLSTTSVSVAESGTTATFSVVLDTQPAGNVVIYAFSSDPGEAQVGAPLTFTSSNWATPQNFTITGRDDSIVEGNQQAIFTVKIDDDLS
ncbi:MAG: SBBP repeat-containing protein, partial [Acidimicrobiales bacterium]|nr:SBBP repeat-containing protein [Acidimicrobiales bacterium]